MTHADHGTVSSLRNLYVGRYRVPCLLSADTVLSCVAQAQSLSWVRDTTRMSLRIMRRVETGMWE